MNTSLWPLLLFVVIVSNCVDCEPQGVRHAVRKILTNFRIIRPYKTPVRHKSNLKGMNDQPTSEPIANDVETPIGSSVTTDEKKKKTHVHLNVHDQSAIEKDPQQRTSTERRTPTNLIPPVKTDEKEQRTPVTSDVQSPTTSRKRTKFIFDDIPGGLNRIKELVLEWKAKEDGEAKENALDKAKDCYLQFHVYCHKQVRGNAHISQMHLAVVINLGNDKELYDISSTDENVKVRLSFLKEASQSYPFLWMAILDIFNKSMMKTLHEFAEEEGARTVTHFFLDRIIYVIYIIKKFDANAEKSYKKAVNAILDGILDPQLCGSACYGNKYLKKAYEEALKVARKYLIAKDLNYYQVILPGKMLTALKSEKDAEEKVSRMFFLQIFLLEELRDTGHKKILGLALSVLHLVDQNTTRKHVYKPTKLITKMIVDILFDRAFRETTKLNADAYRYIWKVYRKFISLMKKILMTNNEEQLRKLVRDNYDELLMLITILPRMILGDRIHDPAIALEHACGYLRDAHRLLGRLPNVKGRARLQNRFTVEIEIFLENLETGRFSVVERILGGLVQRPEYTPPPPEGHPSEKQDLPPEYAPSEDFPEDQQPPEYTLRVVHEHEQKHQVHGK